MIDNTLLNRVQLMKNLHIHSKTLITVTIFLFSVHLLSYIFFILEYFSFLTCLKLSISFLPFLNRLRDYLFPIMEILEAYFHPLLVYSILDILLFILSKNVFLINPLSLSLKYYLERRII